MMLKEKSKEGLQEARDFANEFIRVMKINNIKTYHVDYHSTIYGMCATVEMFGFEVALYWEEEYKVLLHSWEKGSVKSFKDIKSCIPTIKEWLSE